MPHPRTRAWWWLLALAAVSMIVLAALQFRWIATLKEAERDRTEAYLRASAQRIGEQFDDEVQRLFRGLQTVGPMDDEELQDFDVLFGRADLPVFERREVRHVYAITNGADSVLRFDPSLQRFVKAEWPAQFGDLKRRLAVREVTMGPRGEPMAGPMADPVPVIVLPRIRDPRPPGPRPDRGPPMAEGERRRGPDGEGPPGPERDGRPMRRPLRGWMICELNLEYLKDNTFPMLIERHLATAAGVDYFVQVVTSGEPHRVVFASDSSVSEKVMEKPDTVAGLFQMRGQPAGPEGRRPPRRELRRDDPAGDEPRRERRGEWQLLARHKAGSVESAITALHRRNVVLSMSSLALLAGAFALLILSNRRAQRLAQQQVEFVAGVTHELRTPLTVICAAAENLVDGVVSSPERVQTYGAAIKKEGGRLVDVVEKIFRFARLETGRVEYEMKPVELEPLIRQAIAACEAEGVDVEAVDVTAPAGLRVMADGPALAHCLRNLVSNAWKYGGDQKRVRVRVTQVGAQTRIDVEDEGIGMEAADARRVFEPFFRGRAATERQIGGAGLGLTLVKGIVDGHRGKIEVSSAPGKGSRFTIVLPKSGNGSQNPAG